MEENKENVIVPSYMKTQKKDSQKGTNQTKHKKKKLRLTKRFYIIFFAVILSIALIFGIVFFARVIKYSKYDQYSKRMDNYGLSEFFNNGKSTSFQKVTKLEAIKIISTIFSDVGKMEDYFNIEEKYEGELWINRVVELGIITHDQINEKNYNDTITYIEYITYFQNARKAITNASLDTSVYPNFSDIDNIEPEQLYALSEMVSQKLLENSDIKIKPNRVLYKGELNKITIEFLDTYNLMLPEGKKYNVNEEKTPDNADEYTYILFDVDKETYEKSFIVKNEKKFISPTQVYQEKRNSIEQIALTTEQYFNNVLNIDYETINVDEFKNVINDTTLFGADEKIVNKYIDYIKQNKIKIQGQAKAQLPILYYDGVNYRLRMKLSFEILSSDTNKNILYYDFEQENNEIVYDSKKYEFLIDAIIDTPSSKRNLMYVWEDSIYNQRTDEKIENITLSEIQQEDEEDIVREVE